MAFDKLAFRESLKAQYALAANPTFVPTPDLAIQDEGQRAAAHAAALERAAVARSEAIADVFAHAAANYVSQRLPEVFRNGGNAGIPVVTDGARAADAPDGALDGAVELLIMALQQIVKG